MEEDLRQRVRDLGEHPACEEHVREGEVALDEKRADESAEDAGGKDEGAVAAAFEPDEAGAFVVDIRRAIEGRGDVADDLDSDEDGDGDAEERDLVGEDIGRRGRQGNGEVETEAEEKAGEDDAEAAFVEGEARWGFAWSVGEVFHGVWFL